MSSSGPGKLDLADLSTSRSRTAETSITPFAHDGTLPREISHSGLAFVTSPIIRRQTSAGALERIRENPWLNGLDVTYRESGFETHLLRVRDKISKRLFECELNPAMLEECGFPMKSITVAEAQRAIYTAMENSDMHIQLNIGYEADTDEKKASDDISSLEYRDGDAMVWTISHDCGVFTLKYRIRLPEREQTRAELLMLQIEDLRSEALRHARRGLRLKTGDPSATLAFGTWQSSDANLMNKSLIWDTPIFAPRESIIAAMSDGRVLLRQRGLYHIHGTVTVKGTMKTDTGYVRVVADGVILLQHYTSNGNEFSSVTFSIMHRVEDEECEVTIRLSMPSSSKRSTFRNSLSVGRVSPF